MSKPPPAPPAELVVIDREERHLYQTIRYDMSSVAAQAQIDAAREQHGVPARQETYRTAIVAGSLVFGTAALHLLGVNDTVLVALIVALGGGWGVTSVIGKLRQPKLPPPPPDRPR
jgi:hypothetical protein